MSLSVFRTLLEVKQLGMRDREYLEHLQEKLLEKMIERARKTNYYRDLLKEIPANDFDLESFPLTEKDTVRNNTENFIPEGFDKKSLKMVTTSGSTGKPTNVFIDKTYSDYRRAQTLARSMTQGRTPFDTIAVFHSRSKPHKPRISSKFGLFRFIALHSTMDELENLEFAKKEGTDILAAYPSVAEILAKLNLESKNPMRLKYVTGGGEMLYPDARKLIGESFSCPVYSNYAAWEFGPIAWECPEEKRHHVNMDNCIVEIVDSKGKPKMNGSGELILTGLRNHAMPLIRYRIGDRASWGKDCPCGRDTQVLNSLEGRFDDFIVLPSGRCRPSFSIVLTTIEAAKSSISMYQVVQEKEDLFVFKYVPKGKGLNESDKREITNRISIACMGEKIKVEFEELDSIPRDKSGKLRRIISKVARSHS
jgi:phenylacetate-CoA ligase